MIRLPGIWLILTMSMTLPCAATVNVVVSTYDGLVVAADSRVILQGDEKTRIASDFGQKIVRVGSHVAVAFSGAAHLYDDEANLRNISSIVELYKSKKDLAETTRTFPRAVAVGLDSLLTILYNRNQLLNLKRGELELVICGYDREKERRIFKLTYPKAEKVDSNEYRFYGKLDSSFLSGTPGSLVYGQRDVWCRLIKGYDPKILEYSCVKTVKDVKAADSTDSTFLDSLVHPKDTLALDGLRYDIKYDLMTLQDAIDFALFIVRATIEAQRFNQASIQGVGGAIDIAVITPDGFRWVQRKALHGEAE